VKQPQIIYQDQEILIINKPYGLVVNRAESVKQKTLQDWVEKKFDFINPQKNTKSLDFIKRSGIVHRLDKDTSGAMVIAKNIKCFKHMQQQFQQRQVEKKYLALAHGKLEPKSGDIKMPLARQLKNRKKFAVRLSGRQAITYYQVKKYLHKDGEKFSLVKLQPKTGRTHQLRVHLKHLGHPIVSDPIYLGKKRQKQDELWCPRLFLHAQCLKFQHPELNKKLEFEAELEITLKHCLSLLTEKQKKI
jgi:23S rRNA pseudouridine1911/1915/1917 synthase